MPSIRRTAAFAVVTLLAALSAAPSFAMGHSGAPTRPAVEPQPQAETAQMQAMQAQIEALRQELAALKTQVALSHGVASAK